MTPAELRAFLKSLPVMEQAKGRLMGFTPNGLFGVPRLDHRYRPETEERLLMSG